LFTFLKIFLGGVVGGVGGVVGGGAHLGEDRTMALAETAGPGPVVRVKLCLRSNHDHCGAYANAESEYCSF